MEFNELVDLPNADGWDVWQIAIDMTRSGEMAWWPEDGQWRARWHNGLGMLDDTGFLYSEQHLTSRRRCSASINPDAVTRLYEAIIAQQIS
jgi:hypothetical protein